MRSPTRATSTSAPRSSGGRRWSRSSMPAAPASSRLPERGQDMLTDRYGLPITTTSQEAREAYIKGADGVLAAGDTDKADLRRAVAADPDFALAHIALARASFIV